MPLEIFTSTYFSPLHRKYEIARYFQIKMKQTSEITLYQKKLLKLVQEILNNIDVASQERQGIAEALGVLEVLLFWFGLFLVWFQY